MSISQQLKKQIFVLTEYVSFRELYLKLSNHTRKPTNFNVDRIRDIRARYLNLLHCQAVRDVLNNKEADTPQQTAIFLTLMTGIEHVVAKTDRGGNTLRPTPKRMATNIDGEWWAIFTLFFEQKRYIYSAERQAWEQMGVEAGRIYEYNQDPLEFLDKKRLPNERPGKFETAIPYFGVELEVNTRTGKYRSSDPEFARIAVQTNNVLGKDFVMLKHDGSIGNGFEIVTAPATLGYHYKRWEEFFKTASKDLWSWGTDRCGMHVHISRDAFHNPSHLAKMVAFYNFVGNRDFVSKVAGRHSPQYAEYKMESFLAGKFAGYTKEAVRVKPDEYSWALLSPAHNQGMHPKHRAVNFGNKKHTVEIRVFKGNISKVGFFKNLEFVAAVFEYSKSIQYNEKTRIKPNKFHKSTDHPFYGLHHKDFLKWLGEDKSNKYSYLKLWLFNNKLLDVYTNKTITDEQRQKIIASMGRKKDKLNPLRKTHLPLQLLTEHDVQEVA